MQNQEIRQELAGINSHLPANTEVPMQVPEGYFDSLHIDLMQRIRNKDMLGSLSTQNPFALPSGYFENFEQEIIPLIQREVYLESLPVDTPYALPQNYFDHFEKQLMAHVLPAAHPSLRLAKSRKLYHSISIAATLLLFLGLAFKGILLSSGQRVKSVEMQLSYIPDQEISNYLRDHEAEIGSSLALENLDEQALDFGMVEAEILDQALNAVSDEEVSNYPL